MKKKKMNIIGAGIIGVVLAVIGCLIVYIPLVRDLRIISNNKSNSISEYAFKYEDLVSQYNDIEKKLDKAYSDIAELKEYAQQLASLSPLTDLLSTTDIESIILSLEPSTPFESTFRITSSFGEGRGYQGALRRGHLGTDIVPTGNWNIHPMWAGVVEDIGIDKNLGKYIIIDVQPNVRILYAHLSKIFYTALPGEEVTPDTLVGIMGDTGHADGAHLHFQLEIFDGEKWKAIDGKPFLRRD